MRFPVPGKQVKGPDPNAESE
ncbi:MAG: hypothetical protein RI903_575, partial [Bacteroidota bacterium]